MEGVLRLYIGIDVNSQDVDGNTALHHLVWLYFNELISPKNGSRSDLLKMVKVLIKNGANPSMKNSCNKTPYQIAAGLHEVTCQKVDKLNSIEDPQGEAKMRRIGERLKEMEKALFAAQGKYAKIQVENAKKKQLDAEIERINAKLGAQKKERNGATHAK
ncbi:MAG: ankyrin repeat domain-containing protein [Puniceicoccales bacterium]|jgi:ankyrin repeat protein|nr:ankyrin repeat domain-containing protein [Puniceicoccales bacterium]